MEIKALDLPGAYLLKPRRFGDARGFFVELYNKRTLAAHGLQFDFVQDNVSLSAQSGTIRGLHFQPPPSAQAKLVSVLSGAILDVFVDIRAGSPTYGRHVAIELTSENGLQALVPHGFAHGFCSLANETLVQYKVDAHYDPERDLGLLWNDPDLGIEWPLEGRIPVMSDKDQKLPRLAEIETPF